MKKFYLILAGFLYAFSAVIAAILQPYLNAFEVFSLRTSIACLMFGVCIYVKKISLKLKLGSCISVGGYSLSWALSAIFFTLAIFNTKISLAIFAHYVSNIVSAFICGRILFAEKISFYNYLALIFSLIAVYFIGFGSDSFKEIDSFTNNFLTIDKGIFYSLIAGFLQTLATIFQKAVPKVHTMTISFYQTLVGVIVANLCVLFFTETTLLHQIQFNLATEIFIFGFSFAAITWLSVEGFKYVNLSTGYILLASEVLFAPFLAYFMFKEVLTTWEIIGGFFTFIAIALSSYEPRKK